MEDYERANKSMVVHLKFEVLRFVIVRFRVTVSEFEP